MSTTTSTVASHVSQLSKLHLMPWSPHASAVLDAYSRFSHNQLVLFLTMRSLPTNGSDDELVSRLTQFDLQTYHLPDSHPSACSVKHAKFSPSPINGVVRTRQQQARRLPDLPTEILVEILDLLGDWELSKAVGLPTSLPRPLSWARASVTDEAMLTGFVPLIRSADPARTPPTRAGAILTIRFGYVHVLDALLHSYRSHFSYWFRNDIIPVIASQYGRTCVLNWWKHAVDAQILPKPSPKSVSEAIDGACRNGERASLDWWVASKLPLEYSESALESASAKNRVHILEWWKHSGLPLKIGRVMDMASSAGHVDVLSWWLHSSLEFKYDRTAIHHASMHGKVEVLQWWLESGLQMIFDQDALTLATRHNRPEVLEWWDRSGLPVQYRICDIEEALEDAIGGGEAARTEIILRLSSKFAYASSAINLMSSLLTAVSASHTSISYVHLDPDGADCWRSPSRVLCWANFVRVMLVLSWTSSVIIPASLKIYESAELLHDGEIVLPRPLS
ncbi:uncharacterized protein FOMMEDRAFT_164857, partial [Fomitiporia mediterranea MF3/22]|uniref:uncharacterized protein n=1 Tax=Fomitiporia mediterranea (strain MF3/22) TaxID=694068 RepID=UPI0004409938